MLEEIEDVKCPECGTENIGEASFCKECGYQLNEFIDEEEYKGTNEYGLCPECSTEAEENASYCINCGNEL